MTTGDDATLRFTLAEKAYDEVLDATKHQDDKIGRLLTAVAFLTAAAVALANAGDQALLRTRFHVDPFVLPVGAVAFGGFLAGIVLTVIALVASLTTSLQLPGSAGGSDKDEKKVSLLFFSSIVAYSDEDEWRPEWQSSSAKDLQARMTDDFVAEAHNLALRTNHKYSRTNEAVGVLSYALLLFAVSGLLTLVAVASARVPSPAGQVPVYEVYLPTRLLLTLLVGGYCLLQVVFSWRERWRAVDKPRRVTTEDGYLVVVAPALVAAFVLIQGPRLAECAALVAAGVVLGGLGPVWPRLVSWRARLLRVAGHLLLAAGALAAFRSGYGWQLLGAVAVPFLLAARGVLQSEYKDRERRKRYERRRLAATTRGPG